MVNKSPPPLFSFWGRNPEASMLQGFTFVPARPAKGLQMLEAFGNDTFWRCFEDKLEIWEATFKEAELPKLTGCNLANRKQTSSKRETNQDQPLSSFCFWSHFSLQPFYLPCCLQVFFSCGVTFQVSGSCYSRVCRN